MSDWTAIILGILFIAVVVCCEKASFNRFKAKCEASGGVAHNNHPSEPICFPKGGIIPIQD